MMSVTRDPAVTVSGDVASRGRWSNQARVSRHLMTPNHIFHSHTPIHIPTHLQLFLHHYGLQQRRKSEYVAVLSLISSRVWDYLSHIG